MSLRQMTARQLSAWSDDVFRAALEERPLPAGHPISWDVLAMPGPDGFTAPVFSDPNLTPLDGDAT